MLNLDVLIKCLIASCMGWTTWHLVNTWSIVWWFISFLIIWRKWQFVLVPSCQAGDFYCQPATVAYQYIVPHDFAWWRHQMETFSALLAICAGNSPVPGEFPAQRPVTRSFDVFFDLHPNKRLSKQRWGWWFETLSCPLWCHRNGTLNNTVIDNITWQHAVRLLDFH